MPAPPIKKVVFLFLLSCLSAALLTFCFPPHPYGKFLVWIALVPFFCGLSLGLKVWRLSLVVFLYGFFLGFFYHLGVLSWWVQMFVLRGEPIFAAALFTFLICSYAALYTGLFSILLFWFERRFSDRSLSLIFYLRPFLAAALWVSLEFLLTKTINGLTWSLIGYSLWNSLPMLQISAFTGIWGLSFMVVFTNAAMAFCLMDLLKASASLSGPRTEGRKNRITAYAGMAMTGFIWVILYLYGKKSIENYSAWPQKEQNEQTLPFQIAALHAHVGVEKILQQDYNAFSLSVYKPLVEQAGKDIALVLWPELSILNLNVPEILTQVQKAIKGSTANHIVGAQLYEEDGRYFNAAVLFSPQAEKLAEYRKLVPVPYAEMPFFSEPKTNEDIFPGKEVALLPISLGQDGKRVEIAPAICWESAFPEIVRAFVKRKAQLLVHIVEGGWFNKKAKFQCFMMGRFRAIENRRFFVSSANNGISGVFAPSGAIQKMEDSKANTIFFETILPQSGISFYTRFGEWFPWFCLGFIVLSLSAFFFKREIRFDCWF